MLKISVITITLNCQDMIQRTIESVLTQEYKNIEYLIWDGKSKDSTRDVILKYITPNADRIQLWVENDSGIYDAMNKVVKNATGDYVIFLNAGDYFYSSHTLSSFVNRLNMDGSIDIIYGNTISYSDKRIEGLSRKVFSKKMLYMSHTICHQSILAKVSLFDEYKFNEAFRYCADRDWIYHMYVTKKKFEHIDEDVVFYENSGVSSTSNAHKQIIEERYRLQKKYCKPFFYFHKIVRTAAKCLGAE